MPEPSITRETERYFPHPAWAPAVVRVQARMEFGPTAQIPGRGRHAVAVEIDPGDYQGRHRAAEVAAA